MQNQKVLPLTVSSCQQGANKPQSTFHCSPAPSAGRNCLDVPGHVGQGSVWVWCHQTPAVPADPQGHQLTPAVPADPQQCWQCPLARAGHTEQHGHRVGDPVTPPCTARGDFAELIPKDQGLSLSQVTHGNRTALSLPFRGVTV